MLTCRVGLAVLGPWLACGLLHAQCYLAAPAPPDLEAGEFFGSRLALSAEHCAVGVSARDGADPANAACNSGAAYVFEFVGGNWVQGTLVPEPTPSCLEGFGSSVVVDGTTLAVGAPNKNSFAGSVFVYERQGSVWNQVAELTAANAEFFGVALALNNGRLVIASGPATLMSPIESAVFVFEKVGGVWTQVQRLTPSDPLPFKGFGSAVAIQDNVLVVGAKFDPFPCDSGSAYVFEFIGGMWVEVQKLLPPVVNCGAFFGNAVALGSNVIAVNSFGADINCPTGLCDNGAVYIYRKSAIWEEEQEIVSSPLENGSGFGQSLAFDDADCLVVGSPNRGGQNNGAVITFRYTGVSGWSQEQLFMPPDSQPGDRFGHTLAAVQGHVLVSSPEASLGGSINIGRVYYYANTPPGVGCESNFIRGDCNGDGTKNIADAVFTLSFLFPFGAPPTFSCEDACDANDDGVINIADSIALLGSLFGAPTVPLPPPIFCDLDLTPDGLSCIMSPACP